jgi:hypothetical protein
VIFAPENSNKFPKTRFWKEKSVEHVVTLGPTAKGHTSSDYFTYYNLLRMGKTQLETAQIWPFFIYGIYKIYCQDGKSPPTWQQRDSLQFM